MGITLERCAHLRAEMDAGRQRDQVLARAGLAVDEWTLSQREWLDRMGAELALGRYELTNRYTQAFLERQRALAAPPLVTASAARGPRAEALSMGALPPNPRAEAPPAPPARACIRVGGAARGGSAFAGVAGAGAAPSRRRARAGRAVSVGQGSGPRVGVCRCERRRRRG